VCSWNFPHFRIKHSAEHDGFQVDSDKERFWHFFFCLASRPKTRRRLGMGGKARPHPCRLENWIVTSVIVSLHRNVENKPAHPAWRDGRASIRERQT
jgi:hypothetical protein